MLEHLNTWPEAVLERFNSGSTVSLRSRLGPVNSGVKPSFRAISNGFREVLSYLDGIQAFLRIFGNFERFRG